MDNAYVDKDSCIEAIIKKMKDNFDKYWGQCNLVMFIIAILDPRNKMQLIDYYIREIYSTFDSIKHIATVCETLHMLYHEYLEVHNANNVD